MRLYFFICKKIQLAHYHPIRGLPRWLSDKESTCQCRRHKRQEFNSWVGKIPWSRKWQPTPLFLPGKFNGQRSLVGYSPWGRKRVRYDWAKQVFWVWNTANFLIIFFENFLLFFWSFFLHLKDFSSSTCENSIISEATTSERSLGSPRWMWIPLDTLTSEHSR